MSRLRLTPIAVCLLLAAPARAQEQVEVFTAIIGTRTSLVNVDATVRGFGNVLAVTPLTHVPTDFLNHAATVAGGRYLAWLAGSAIHTGQDLCLFDRRTRTVSMATDALPTPPPDAFWSWFHFTHPLAFHGALTEPGGRVVWVNDGYGMNTLDARTGAVLATSPYSQASRSTYDPARGVLLVRQDDCLVVVDPLRLTELGRARVSFSVPSNLLAESTQTLPGRWMTGAYLLRSSYRYGSPTCNEITLESLDTSGAKRATADLLV